MKHGGYRPVLAVAINTLTILSNSRHPQPNRMFAEGRDSFWRIAPVALKVGSHGAVHLHHRRRGFLARKRSGFSGARRPVAGTWLQGPASQARSLSPTRTPNGV